MLGVTGDVDGFLHFGPVAVLIDQRDDLELRTAEPGRVVLNYTVTDIKAWVERLSARGASWVAELEYRDAGGAWFATTADPDGNHVQLIELTPDYWRQRRERQQGSPLARAALRDAHVAPRLPAQDLERARRFYSERLGLEPAESRPGAYRYELDGTDFAIFASTGAASGTHTQLGFYVADLDSTVAELRERGLEFDEYEMAGTTSAGGIIDVPGNYPSTGASGERAIFFHDSEGNLLGIGELVY
jgi:predicted enzyme related to lactoylglutathione lyase